MKRLRFGKGLILGGLMLGVTGSAAAMPWDVDMYRQQSLIPGEIARNPVKGTIPVGHTPWKMTTEDASKKLVNPILFTASSIIKGKRLFSSNCIPCHGSSGKGGEEAAVTQLGAPDITGEFYASKSDGSVYGLLMNGGANMPRYGYKFSESERWHLVNYVRSLQGKKVSQGN